ncbi:MAG: trypsin-like peptidase domain-containing protein [SAR324 cluster bacterium]|nr:trypsin-like peptidase domain-containing protein [SAR324 cluster bacterium]
MQTSFKPALFFRLFFLLFVIVFFATAKPLWAIKFTEDERQNIKIYKSEGPGVVNITSITVNYDFFYGPLPESGSGSGFVIDSQGHILTNFHVVEQARELTVTLSDNSQWKAEVKGYDPSNDLAVIKIKNPPKNLTVLELEDSSKLVVGQKVLALGNPFALRQTLTTGIISALGRTIEAKNGRKIDGVIQSDAAINPGNSGGPLLNTEGKVIGINTAIIGAAGSVGIGFAVPSNTASKIIPDLKAYGYVRRPWLGIEAVSTDRLRRLFSIPEGMLIINLVKGASAAKAGLRGATEELRIGNYRVPWGGDIITAIEDKPVHNFEELADIIESYQPGERVNIHFIRNDRKQSVLVRLEERPKP